VPIAHQLHAHGNKIFICANGPALDLMQMECSYAQFVEDIPLKVSYGKTKNSTSLKLLLQLPLMLMHVYREHQWLKKLVKQHQIDLVIADNRYGFYHQNIPCVFITHQLNIKVPFGAAFVNFLNHYFIKKFKVCWVPDFEPKEKALAGELSRKNDLQNIVYIGPLSRASAVAEPSNKKAPVLYLLSGLEPQRTLLEKLILKRHTLSPHQAILIRGTNHAVEKIIPQNNLIVYDLVDVKILQNLVSSCKYVVCRSGYSSIMDLLSWQKNALLIPTPGQSEQEYLAQYLVQKKWFYSCAQSNFIQFQEVELNGFQYPPNENLTPNFAELLEAL
jgi:UDP-N-acetylglucosamine transferase subunit ALG13